MAEHTVVLGKVATSPIFISEIELGPQFIHEGKEHPPLWTRCVRRAGARLYEEESLAQVGPQLSKVH
jgi:hypothetical protein